jgi:Flp pilus assembly protein TadB
MGRRRFHDSPISAKKDELAKKEEELRREMEELQRTIEEAPKLVQAEQERQRQERIARASTRRSPFDSPDILQDSRHGEDLFSERPRRPRRAQRRQARMRLLISCLAVLALAAIVIFLAIQMFNHLP